MQTLRLFCCDISSSQKRCTEIGNCKLINNDTYSIYHFHSKSDNWRLKSVQTVSKRIYSNQIYNSGLILFMYPFFFLLSLTSSLFWLKGKPLQVLEHGTADQQCNQSSVECAGSGRKEILSRNNTAALSAAQRAQHETRVSKERQNSMPVP